MNDASGGTHAETDALESMRKTEAYPGEPTLEGDTSDELRHLKDAIDEAAQKPRSPQGIRPHE